MDRIRQRRNPALNAPTLAATLPAPFGALGIFTVCGTDGEALHEIRFMPPDSPLRLAGSALVRETAAQLQTYLADPAYVPTLPPQFVAQGTPFQQQVWALIRAIPPGHTRSYGELATALQSAARAVGQACGSNPFPIFTPCHRVLAAQQRLGGFAHASSGFTLDAKRWLLSHESRS